MKKFWYILSFVTVHPRRWLFWKMVWSWSPRWKITQPEFDGDVWRFPNIHWWVLYKTVFLFFKWLHYDAWRPFCDWTGGYRRSCPWVARLIQRIGQTTAGFAISGGECFHCGSPDGDPVHLSNDETGKLFEFKESWSVSTGEGTDHRFCGTTICPKCGYRQYYEDGSL